MDSSQAKPTVEQVNEWDVDKLLDWIKKQGLKELKDDQLKKLEQEGISGVVFLNHAGDVGFFKRECGLTAGASDRLANLSRELAKEDSKLLSFMSCTPRRHQTNSVTGNRQQAEDVEMSDTASKSILPMTAEDLKMQLMTTQLMTAQLMTAISGEGTAGIKSKFTIFTHAHYVDCKLTTSQETYSRPDMRRCSIALVSSPTAHLCCSLYS